MDICFLDVGDLKTHTHTYIVFQSPVATCGADVGEAAWMEWSEWLLLMQAPGWAGSIKGSPVPMSSEHTDLTCTASSRKIDSPWTAQPVGSTAWSLQFFLQLGQVTQFRSRGINGSVLALLLAGGAAAMVGHGG